MTDELEKLAEQEPKPNMSKSQRAMAEPKATKAKLRPLSGRG